MQKKMSTFERYFRAEGEAKGIVIGEAKGIAIGEAKGRVEGEVKGTENTIRNFIERKRSRHVSEEDIFEELRLDFGLDIQSARRYMEPSLVNA
jgi:predicted transposase YdaD